MLLYNLQMHQRYLKNATKCYNKLWHHPILLVINSVWIFSCFIYRSIYRNVGNCTSFSSRGVTTSLKTSNAERSPPPLWLWGNSWSTITLTIPQDECSSKLFWAVRTHPGSVRVEMQNGYTVKQLIFFLCFQSSKGKPSTLWARSQPTVVTHNHTPGFSPVHLPGTAEAPVPARYWALWKTLPPPQKDAQTNHPVTKPCWKIHFWLGFFFFLTSCFKWLVLLCESLGEIFRTLSDHYFSSLLENHLFWL